MNKEYDNDKYFNSLINIFKKTRNYHTYYLPNPYKFNGIRDSEKNKNFFNFKKIFDKDYLIHDKKKYAEAEVIFLSHYLGYEHKKDEDFYYGKIFDILKKKKINYTILTINKSNYQLETIKKKFKNTKHSRIYINHYSHPLKDFKFIFKLLFLYLTFFFKKKNIKFNQREKNIILEKFSFLNFIQSRTTIKLANTIDKILENFDNNTKCFIFTFEGHAFERMIVEICKKRQIKSVGYFFSVIREYKTNIFYRFPDFIMPDCIFTTGSIIKNYFKRNLNKVKNIHTIGSGRKFLKRKFNLNKLISAKTSNLLLCPEGLYSETDLMFNLGINLSKYKKNIKIDIRIHPELKQNKKYINNLKYKTKHLKNFKISNNSLENDIKNNHLLIYRGSSICVNGVLGGMIPIYFKLPNEKSIDPLFEVNRYEVANEKELLRKIDFFKNIKNSNKLNIKIKKLFNYCEHYFENFDEKNIKTYIKNEF